MYQITLAQWEMIDPICKHTTANGSRFFRERDEQTQEVVLVPVVIVEHPVPVVAPKHYGNSWPVDPRD